jgi:hypothetical protein
LTVATGRPSGRAPGPSCAHDVVCGLHAPTRERVSSEGEIAADGLSPASGSGTCRTPFAHFVFALCRLVFLLVGLCRCPCAAVPCSTTFRVGSRYSRGTNIYEPYDHIYTSPCPGQLNTSKTLAHIVSDVQLVVPCKHTHEWLHFTMSWLHFTMSYLHKEGKLAISISTRKHDEHVQQCFAEQVNMLSIACSSDLTSCSVVLLGGDVAFSGQCPGDFALGGLASGGRIAGSGQCPVDFAIGCCASRGKMSQECRDFQKGHCRFEDRCKFLHDGHPAQDWDDVDEVPEEAREPVRPTSRTRRDRGDNGSLCRHFEKGSCYYGPRCRFSHDLSRRSDSESADSHAIIERSPGSCSPGYDDF